MSLSLFEDRYPESREYADYLYTYEKILLAFLPKKKDSVTTSEWRQLFVAVMLKRWGSLTYSSTSYVSKLYGDQLFHVGLFCVSGYFIRKTIAECIFDVLWKSPRSVTRSEFDLIAKSVLKGESKYEYSSVFSNIFNLLIKFGNSKKGDKYYKRKNKLEKRISSLVKIEIDKIKNYEMEVKDYLNESKLLKVLRNVKSGFCNVWEYVKILVKAKKEGVCPFMYFGNNQK